MVLSPLGSYALGRIKNLQRHSHSTASSQVGLIGRNLTEPTPFFPFELFPSTQPLRKRSCQCTGPSLHRFFSAIVERSSHRHFVLLLFRFNCVTFIWHKNNNMEHKSKQAKSRHPRAWSSIFFSVANQQTFPLPFFSFLHVDVVFRSHTNTVHLFFFCYLEQVFLLSFEIVCVSGTANAANFGCVCVRECERLQIEQKNKQKTKNDVLD